MKRMFKLLTLLWLLAAAPAACSDKGPSLPSTPGGPATFDRYSSTQMMFSNTLAGEIRFAVYLPASYLAEQDRRYPVVYLLHGYGDNHEAWNDQWLHICDLIEQKEQAGEISEMIYVMPTGYNSYYSNRYDGSFDYMDMFVEELVPYIDRIYRTEANRSKRAVVGYSMGGFGAMILPTKHPELFSVSVPLSMSFRTDEQYMAEPQNGWNEQWGKIFGGVGMMGEARLTDYYKAHCPFYLFTAEGYTQYADVKYYLDCGDDEEQLLIANDRLHRQMREIGMPHEYRVRNGAHTSDYWRGAMREALEFIECCFNGETYPTEQPTTTNPAYSGVSRQEEVNGTSIALYPSAGYKEEGGNTIVWCLHEGLSQEDQYRILNLWNVTSLTKPFVVAMVDGTNLDRASLEEVMTSIEERTGSAADAQYRLGVATGKTAGLFYELAGRDQATFSALFLYDACIDTTLPLNPTTYYWIDTTDLGEEYRSAGELYEKCKREEVPYDYRVRNGEAGTKGLLGGIAASKDRLKEYIKNK